MGTELCPMRTAPGGTISGRRPLPEVPWPDGINHSSSAIDNRSASRRPSRGPDASAITCKKVPDGAFLVRSANSDRNAHIHVAWKCSQRLYCRFAHILRFKNNMPPERYDRKSVRAVSIQYGCRPDDFRFHRSGGMYVLNLNMCAKVRCIL